MANEPLVKVPEAMFRSLEAKAIRLAEIETLLAEAVAGLGKYRVTTVLTVPASGVEQLKVLRAVQSLITLAQGIVR